MHSRVGRPLSFGLCALVCVAAAASWWPHRRDVRTDDKNRDGRPDVWRVYDRQGQLVTMAVDTNFDGRSDVHEYYERGALVRRESDTDFNDRVDLIQEFDATTRQTVRSVSDVDLDGVADLLVLFQDGRPVYSEWAHGSPRVEFTRLSGRLANASQGGLNHHLAPLEDPFRGNLAVRAAGPGPGFGDCAGLATAGGLPASTENPACPLASASGLSAPATSNFSSAVALDYSPRGPPPSHLLT
jgi:hypothetical protein